MKRKLLTSAVFIAAFIPLLVMMGCGDLDQTEVRSNVWVEVTNTVYTTTAGDTDVAVIDVCRLDAETGFCTYDDEYCTVTFRVHAVNPEFSETPSSYMDVHITRSRVSYFRNDGGTNVPGTFDQHIDYFLPFEGEAAFLVKILHADQKADPPLIWLNTQQSFGYEPGTGLAIIKGWCVMQFWGQDNAGNNVSAETRIPVQFADWGND